jgi:outer membrane immunogenic protein
VLRPGYSVFRSCALHLRTTFVWDGNKGIGTMKRTLIASVALFGGITSAAMAADLPPPMAPPPRAPAAYIPIAPPYNWTGFYLGGNLGAGFSKGTFSDSFGSTFNSSNSNTSFLGGGQVGVNYEFGGGVVIGAEAMFDWAPNTNNTITATGVGPAAGSSATAQLNNRWLTTVTGRLGYAWDRVLFYGKGGGAWVGQSNSNVSVTSPGGGVFPTSLSSNSTNSGWTAGIGVEWAFAGNWSAKAEYDYIGLTNQTYTVSPGAAGGFANDSISATSRSIQLLTAGLNYKFGWGGW